MFNDAETIEECIDEAIGLLGFLQQMQAKGFELGYTVVNDDSGITHIASTVSDNLFEWTEENHLADELMRILHAINHLILNDSADNRYCYPVELGGYAFLER